MSLKFYFGPSGSGKSFHLYHHIIEESVKHPEQNFIVLVPEQFTMQTQKDLVEMHPRKGIMNIDVLSFNRLAYRVFEETGGDQLPMLDDEGKNLILRKIAENEEDRLSVLKGRMSKPGYISEVKSVISEFTQYDISDDDVQQVIDAAGTDSRLGEKLQDILVLYRGFKDYLQEKYITKEELLDVLAGRVSQSEMLADSTIALDGFTGFTPVQERLLKELMLRCRDVWVTVTMDPAEDPFTYQTPYQLFALGKHMTTGLARLAREAKVPVEDPVWLKEDVPYRFRDNPALAFLEKNLFRQNQETYPAARDEDPVAPENAARDEDPVAPENTAQDAVRLAAADHPREEAMYVASQIRSLVRKEGLRYRQIGIIVSDMDAYADDLKRAFAQYEIPYFMDNKRSLLLNSFVEYLRSLLDMMQQNFTPDSVFRFLRTGYAGFSDDEIDALENYVLALGIRGYKRWQQPWTKTGKDMTQDDLAALNRLRVTLVEKVDSLHQVLKQKKKTVRDITLALYEFLVQEDMQIQLKKQEEAFQAEGELALAREYAQVYRIVMDLFDKFVDLLGEEPVRLEEYCQLLDAGLEEAKVGVIPPSVDQVVVGDLERTRLKDIQVLFFMGASDAYLPGQLMRSGLLTEQDRQLFAGAHLTLAPGGKERACEQKYYLYLNLTKPSEKLVVSYSQNSADGHSARPSYLIQELLRLYPHLAVTDVSELSLAEQELTPQQGLALLIRGLRTAAAGGSYAVGGSEEAWQELYTWYRKSKDWQGRLDSLTEAAYFRNPVKGLSEDAARRLYGETFQSSISRMEKFAECPYKHFLMYGLRLQDRQKYEFGSMDLGTVCHDALDRYHKALERKGLHWTDVPEQERNELIRTCVDEAAAAYGNDILNSSAQNQHEIQKIKDMLAWNLSIMTGQLARGDFEPEVSEYRYEDGKIDRIDLVGDEDHVYVQVIDYKTGNQKYDEEEVFNGLNLQLLTYADTALMLAAQQSPGKEPVPAGVYYYHLRDEFVKEKEGQDAQEQLRLDQRLEGLTNREQTALFHLEHDREKTSQVAQLSYDADGNPKKNSKNAVSEEDFRRMTDHVIENIARDRERILEGDVAVEPYWDQNPDMKNAKTGCSYCAYRGICGFEQQIPGYQYKTFPKRNHEQILTALAAEQGSRERNGQDSGE